VSLETGAKTGRNSENAIQPLIGVRIHRRTHIIVVKLHRPIADARGRGGSLKIIHFQASLGALTEFLFLISSVSLAPTFTLRSELTAQTVDLSFQLVVGPALEGTFRREA